LSLLFQCYLSPSALHSFPTRRSSDLSGGWRQSSYHPRLTISLRTPVVLPPTLAITDWRGNVSRKVEASSLGTQKPESATQRGSRDRKSTRLNSSHVSISYAVFCLKKK